MIKSEMTASQLLRRAEFLEALVAYKWTLQEGWEALFEQDVDLEPSAIAEYENDSLNIRLSYYIQEDYLFHECTGKGELGFISRLHLYPLSISKLLDTLTLWQNQLSPHNYNIFVQTITPLCKLVLYESEVGQFFKISLKS